MAGSSCGKRTDTHLSLNHAGNRRVVTELHDRPHRDIPALHRFIDCISGAAAGVGSDEIVVEALTSRQPPYPQVDGHGEKLP